MLMIINEHDLIHSSDAGNGYHGNCEHCGLALVTDLGYTSWSNTKCIDREITKRRNIPKEILCYTDFKGYKWHPKRLVFFRAYDDEEFTLDEIKLKIDEIKLKNAGL